MHATRNTNLLETLENRTMFSAAALDVTEVVADGGIELHVDGTQAADKISVTVNDDGITIRNRKWSESFQGSFSGLVINGGKGADKIKLDDAVTVDASLYGNAGNDTLVGGAGNDSLYGGAGKNTLKGMAGDDVLVTVGASRADRLSGGKGSDAFWCDSYTSEKVTDLSSSEQSAGALHRISAFSTLQIQDGDTIQSYDTGKKLNGPDLADPKTTAAGITYKNFSGQPLFSQNGPSVDDITQGSVGDCYFLATLGAVAKVDPSAIRNSIVDLGDGTYAVQFVSNGVKNFVRVDADLPAWSGSYLAYAQEGAEGSLWVAIMEKAFAYFRTGQGDYSALEGGWMSEAYSALGFSSNSIWSAETGEGLLQQIQGEIVAGKSVTFAVYDAPSGAPVIGSHAYTVDRVNVDGEGNVISLTLRNPWGVDGAGNDGANDGYVTLTPAQALGAFWAVMSAAV